MIRNLLSKCEMKRPENKNEIRECPAISNERRRET
jgi:hypothetical protein